MSKNKVFFSVDFLIEILSILEKVSDDKKVHVQQRYQAKKCIKKIKKSIKDVASAKSEVNISINIISNIMLIFLRLLDNNALIERIMKIIHK